MASNRSTPTRLRTSVRHALGPPGFWSDVATMYARARKAYNRNYLLWEEWDDVIGLVDYYGMLAYFEGGRDANPRAGEEIRPDDFRYTLAGPMLMFLLRRVQSARTRGLTPWQFALEEERRIDSEHAVLVAIDAREKAARARARRVNERGTRAAKKHRREVQGADFPEFGDDAAPTERKDLD